MTHDGGTATGYGFGDKSVNVCLIVLTFMYLLIYM